MSIYLWTTLSAALALLGPRPAVATVRHRLVSRPERTAPAAGRPWKGRQAPPVVVAWIGAGACGLVCVLVAGAAGAMAAVVVVPIAAVVLRRQSSRPAASAGAASRAALPLTCDLIAAGLRAGATVPTALSSAAATAPGPLRDELNRVSALLRLGTSAAEAWSSLARDPVLGSVAAVATRSASSGIRLADALISCSAARREELQAAAVARAERVGVLALLPLGLCFLPAFICLGVVPVIAGIAADVFARMAT